MDRDDGSPPPQEQRVIHAPRVHVHEGHRDGRNWLDEQRLHIENMAQMARRSPPRPLRSEVQFGGIVSWVFIKNQCAEVAVSKIFDILRERDILWWNRFFQFTPTKKFVTPEAILMNIRQVLRGPETTQHKLVIMYTQLVHEGYG